MENYPFSAYGAAVGTDGTFAYVFGGFTSGPVEHDQAYRYDPATNTWTALASMVARPTSCATVSTAATARSMLWAGLTTER